MTSPQLLHCKRFKTKRRNLEAEVPWLALNLYVFFVSASKQKKDKIEKKKNASHYFSRQNHF